MKQQTILVSGGGTGGHITPLIAILQQLRKQPDLKQLKVVYVGQKGDQFASMLDDKLVDQKVFISAGKWRRYHGHGWRQILDFKTLGANLVDAFKVLLGCIEASRHIRKFKPDLVFLKGGYVGVPLAMMAARKHIPIITHDSDAIAGLANRLVARWVKTHLVAYDKKFYPNYSQENTVSVGIPLRSLFKNLKSNKKPSPKQFGLSGKRPILLVIGGSLGGQRLAEAVSLNRQQLTKLVDIIHVTGAASYEKLKHLSSDNYKLFSFMGDELLDALLLSSVVLTRAGATSLAEIAVVNRPMVVVPNPQLVKGHQLINAEIYQKANAAVVINEGQLERDPSVLTRAITELLQPDTAKKMMAAQRRIAFSDSAETVATIIGKCLRDAANEIKS